ncbi:MAG: hypothetical protein GF317_18615 [Candidatus Lokiarchaeota archaeon]|nr:hypothetical protein [Candidatus Lokiarchaeota archaeon]MBD3201530.1 hypothetical protein [Candidatus Lokiarchaeota archaeon]
MDSTPVDNNLDNFTTPDDPQRLCRFIKRASDGELLKLTKNTTTCFGTQNNKIPSKEGLDSRLNLDIRGLKYILLFAANKFSIKNIDGIILIINPKISTILIDIYVELYNKPLKIMCGTQKGVCSEIAAYIVKRNDVNFSFLCTGARKSAKYEDCDLLCGIPDIMLQEMISKIIS